jgi:hypothetical protein
MSKKRKPINPLKHQKEISAQQRNLFDRKLHAIFTGIGKGDAYKLLSEPYKELIYKARFRSLQVMTDDSLNVPAAILEKFNYYFRTFYRDKPIYFENPRFAITIGDYMEIFVTFLCAIDKDIEIKTFKEIELLREIFEEFQDGTSGNSRDTMEASSYRQLDNCGHEFSILCNSIETMLWIDHKLVCNDIKRTNYDAIIIHQLNADSRSFIIENKKRTAYRLGWVKPLGEILWSYITPKDLGLNCAMADLQMDIYIQTHAIERLYSRLDCIPLGLAHLMIVQSLSKPKVKIHKNTTLIEVEFAGIKTGYLVGTVTEGVLLIRTFLLITNSGTPEADKLRELTGLEKDDKTFLSLDRLSSFYSDDLLSNESVKKLLKKIGCDHLHDLKDIIPQWRVNANTQQTASRLEHYLDKADYRNFDWQFYPPDTAPMMEFQESTPNSNP